MRRSSRTAERSASCQASVSNRKEDYKKGMKIVEIKFGQLIAWVIYLLLFALVLMEPNQLMSITEVNDSPGAAIDGLMALIGFVMSCILFVSLDLFFHLFLRHNKFRLSAIILLLFNGIYKTCQYYFIYSGYEGKYLSENTYESVPTADGLILFGEINGIIVLYLITMMLLSKIWGYWFQK